MRQDQPLCHYCGNQIATGQHHLLPRGSNPDKIEEQKNLVPLCFNCHRQAHDDQSFLKALQEIFYYWRPANLDIFMRAQGSISALLNGQEIEYLTPAMTSHYLNLAGAGYSQYSERLAECEKEYAPFFMARKAEDKSNKEIEMEWKCTDRGQEQITAKLKVKALEKLQSNLRANLRRLEVERFNSR
jgi:hypothetical protein